MFHRKDVVPLVFLVLVILTIMVTLSQILVVHNKHHHVQTEPRDLQRFKDILVQLEGHINSMLKKNVLPIHKYRNVFAAKVYAERINSLLEKEHENMHSRQVQNSKKRKLYLINSHHEKKLKDKKYHTRRKLSRTDYERSGTTQNISNEGNNITNYQKICQENKNFLDGNEMSTSGNSANVNPTIVSPLGSLLLRNKDSKDISMPTTTYPTNNDQLISLPRQYSPVGLSDIFGTWETYGIQHTKTAHRSQHKRRRKMGHCPGIPPNLVGRIRVSTNVNITRLTLSYHDDVTSGGHWRPPTCIPRHKVAIIIPYRDRRTHLQTLLFYLIPVLQRQQIEFRIFVVEQAGNRTFNKGIVMNAGFKEAVRMSDYHCYIFHDVDLIPEDDRNMYTCPGFPRHLSVAVDKFRYHLPYSQLVGGVFAIRREDFETVNGYSNLYWGWGAEDDDMSVRLAVAGMKLARPSATIARYKMLKHNARERVPFKWSAYLLKTVKKRFNKDGLSSVSYNVSFIHEEPLFTHIMVDVGDPPATVGNISAIIR